MKNVTVYSLPNCKNCNTAKHELDKRGIAYTTVDLSEDVKALETIKGRGFKSAPVVKSHNGVKVEWMEYARFMDHVKGIK